MKKSLQANTSQCVAIVEKFEKKERSWFPTSHIPTDLIIHVQDINFYVHKLPLISKSEYLSDLLKSRSVQSNSAGFDIKLDNFPGGAETFEIVIKFCYGFSVDLMASNVAPVRCASEFLQMTEEYEEGNLISKTESFIAFIVLSSWRDSITLMKSCESLSPWAENLQILRRCTDAVALKIIRRTSMCNDTDYDGERWWFDDVSILCINHFVRIITAITAKGSKPEIIGASIMHYAKKWLPGMEGLQGQKEYGNRSNELHMTILSGKGEEGSAGEEKEQRRMIEVLVSILPPQREAVPCKFLLSMLKMALVYTATPALVSELEKRVGMVLGDATVNDLLIPSYNNGTEGKLGRSIHNASAFLSITNLFYGWRSPSKERTMHDVDVVQRIVEYFLMHEQQLQQQQSNVGKLLDGYLTEIARDLNLSISKFQALAEVLPQDARTCHDGLYRAIDTYLKTHPTLMEHDRRRLCKAMDCEKLSLDACMHAAQNDRLPLRTVMQVLCSEQIKMRAAMNGKGPTQHDIICEQNNTWSTKKEIRNIICELQKIRASIEELQHDYSQLQQEFEKVNKQKNVFGWSSGWKKFKTSTLFQGKINGVDTTNVNAQGQPGQTRVSDKNVRRRRQSIS
ncbi:BTB/POZ domain-containing protein DOT3 [Thalictrum thalictroides]|uniref:BTB/POZ domain-containing protein DOT3 n=1 Tax=Thalictrum thalictroides TaxID=46969 RepID=A0A7J6VYB6_THATH|nr:BTB/POZ domain-containing protein DOT3 [Thalictrum thalictroides]